MDLNGLRRLKGDRMARKTEKNNVHEFTKQIHSTKRAGKLEKPLKNWNEREAKKLNKCACHDCRYFMGGCSEYIGKWHRPCEDFHWW
jgi:hypothetical protein